MARSSRHQSTRMAAALEPRRPHTPSPIHAAHCTASLVGKPSLDTFIAVPWYLVLAVASPSRTGKDALPTVLSCGRFYTCAPQGRPSLASHICKARVPVFRNPKPLSSQPRHLSLCLITSTHNRGISEQDLLSRRQLAPHLEPPTHDLTFRTRSLPCTSHSNGVQQPCAAFCLCHKTGSFRERQHRDPSSHLVCGLTPHRRHPG